MHIKQNDEFDGKSYDKFCCFLEENCGISLQNSDKTAVLERMNTLLVAHRLSNLNELVLELKKAKINSLEQEVLDRITRPKAIWPDTVEAMSNIFYELIDSHCKGETSSKNKKIRMWSTVCSFGEEAYAISMAFEQALQAHKNLSRSIDAHIIATDISPTILEVAAMGEYQLDAMNNRLSESCIKDYFELIDNKNQRLRVVEKVKQRVKFKKMNLLDNYKRMGQFDFICCNKALIYFSQEIRLDILRRLSDCLEPHGVVYTESLKFKDDFSHYFTIQPLPQGFIGHLKG